MSAKGTAFTVNMGGAGAERAPRPKPSGRRGPFKFLRKAEGQRADTAHMDEEPETTPRPHGSPPREEDFRRALRQDMAKGKADPFASADVAVPKRPPPSKAPERRASPPNNAATAALDNDLGTRSTSQRSEGVAAERNASPDDLGATRAPGRRTTAPPLLEDDVTDDGLDDYDAEQDFSVTAKPRPAREQQPQAAVQRPRQQQHHREQPMEEESRSASEAERPAQRRPQRSRLEMLREAREGPRDGYDEQDEFSAPPPQRRDERVMRRANDPPRRATSAGPSQRRPTADVVNDDVDGGYDNYFQGGANRRPQHAAARTGGASPRAAEAPPADEELLAELERQLEDVRAEKQRYQRLLSDAQRRREREQKEHDDALAELQADRDDFEQWVGEEKRAIRKERRQLEETRRRQADSTGAERDANKRLQAEVEAARDALDKMSSEMRDRDRAHKTELDRQKRRVVDLHARNDELAEMLRGFQASEADSAVAASRADRAAAKQRGAARATSRGRSPSLSDEDHDSYTDDRRGATPPPADYVGHSRGSAQKVSHSDDRRGINRSADVRTTTRRHEDPVVRSESHLARRDDPATAATRTMSHQERRSSPSKPGPSGSEPSAFVLPSPDEFIADVVEPPPAEDVAGDSVIARNVGNDGRSEQLFRSGKRVINFANGTRKVVLQSGHVILHFSNGDVKRTFPSGKTTYWYAVAQTTHTQLPDGLQVFQFHSSQQTEKHFPDGRKEILYPEGVYKAIATDGTEKTYFPDGTVSNTAGEQ
jgi:hypothetical protein